MAKFLLLNSSEEYVQTLKNVTVAKGNAVINGEDTLDLTIFDTQLEKNYRILLQDNYRKWHEYIVQEIEEIHTDKGIRKKIFCESSLYETIGDFIEDRRFNNTTAHAALTGVLQHTRWKVGRVDSLGSGSYSPYRVDAKTAIQTIATTWQGELQTRIEVSGNKITERYIDLLSKIGNNTGKRFTWTKDIKQIKRTVVRDDVITALYGFGKGEEVGDGFGRRIDFSEVNGGKMYVENNEAKEQFGRLGNDGQRVHAFGKIDFDDETDKAILKEKTENELAVMSQPTLSYSAEVLDLKQFGYEHEGYELGDIVTIIDKEFKPELRVIARIIEKETDFLEELNSDVTLGNFIPTSTSEDLKNEGYINNFRDKSGVWDRAGYISDDGKIFIDDLLDQLNEKANATGGYFYYTEGEGTITTDRPIDENPTMAVEIKGGSIRIADSKLPDGSWNWRTALTGKGIVADEINVGVLNAALIQAGFNDIAFGVIMTQYGLNAVSQNGNYLEFTSGSLRVYDRFDNMVGTYGLATGGTSGTTGSANFVSQGHAFTVVRLTPDGEENISIFGVPADVNEFRLYEPFNANSHPIKNAGSVEASAIEVGSFKIKGTNQRIANIVGGGGAYFDTQKVSLGIGNDAGVSMKVTAFADRVEVSENLSLKQHMIENVSNVKPYNNGRESWFFTSSEGHGVIAGRYGAGLGAHDGTNVDVALRVPATGAMVSYRGINMNGNTITNQSDVRLKKNITPVEIDALAENDRMTFVNFEWDKSIKLNDQKPDGPQFGQIAQHAPKIMQKQVDKDNNYLSIDTGAQLNIASLAIQQLNKKVSEQANELSDLKAILKEKGVI